MISAKTFFSVVLLGTIQLSMAEGGALSDDSALAMSPESIGVDAASKLSAQMSAGSATNEELPLSTSESAKNVAIPGTPQIEKSAFPINTVSTSPDFATVNASMNRLQISGVHLSTSKFNPVPEPSMSAIFGAAAVGLVLSRKRLKGG